MPKDDHIFKGLRSKKILGKLNKDNVINLRHPTTQEYKEIFGQNYNASNADVNKLYLPKTSFRPRRKATTVRLPREAKTGGPGMIDHSELSFDDAGECRPPGTRQPEQDACPDDSVCRSLVACQLEQEACPDGSVYRPPDTCQPGQDTCSDGSVCRPPDTCHPKQDACPDDSVYRSLDACQLEQDACPDDSVCRSLNACQLEQDACPDDSVCRPPDTCHPKQDACPDDSVCRSLDACQLEQDICPDDSVCRPPDTCHPNQNACPDDSVYRSFDACQLEQDACSDSSVCRPPDTCQPEQDACSDGSVCRPPDTCHPKQDACPDDSMYRSLDACQLEQDACPDGSVCRSPDTCQPEQNACADDSVFLPSDISQIRQNITRSLSLSDLTHDTINNFKNLKNYQSAPHLGVAISRSTSPSILMVFHRNTSIENDNQLPINDSDDVDSKTSSEFEDEEYFGNMNEGRKRRHSAEPSSWKRNKAKRSRMLGEEYLGYSKPHGRKMQHDTVRPSRQLDKSCDSKFCKKSKVRGCQKFTEECRQNIHRHFWKKLNWDQRKTYVLGLVTRSETSRKTKSAGEDSRRKGTLIYSLPIDKNNSEKVQVCKEMFLNTLSLGSYMVQSWVKQGEFGMTSTQEDAYKMKNTNRKPRAEIERKILTLENFLNCLPKLPSHYARMDSCKLFLEPIYHSLSELYKVYKSYCAEQEEPEVCRFTFEKKFHEKNLSLYTLKKDMCNTCSSYRTGNLNETDYKTHINLKDRAREEKKNDKKKAAVGEFILLSMDLEAVKVCPFLTASALYFKTKLTCHNFTVYNLITRHSTCYWFDETAADLSASTFCTFIIDYLERHCIPLQLPIVIYSDGCTYQNRNNVLSNALLNLSKKYNVTITQKFLEPGHTQMECDSVHSAIERKSKNREIHLPSDYVTITKEARSVMPYETVMIDYNFIKNYASSENLVYKNIRPGRKAGDPHVVDIRVMQYNTMTIEVKLSFDADWIPLPQRPKLLPNDVTYRQLHSNKLPIKATKYNHLQQLKTLLPSDCHAFYDGLPFVE